jgi:hypothetical protein
MDALVYKHPCARKLGKESHFHIFKLGGCKIKEW